MIPTRLPRNPILLPQAALAPPSQRSRQALGLAVAAAQGRFMLQVCSDCGGVCYPPREACPICLSAGLAWRDVPANGVVSAETTIRISIDPYFRAHAPWRIGSVRLESGPNVIAHLHADLRAGALTRLALKLDKAGQAVMFALPATDKPDMHDDPQFREMICDPRGRRVLVTDGRTGFGQGMAQALIAAGAEVFMGVANRWQPFPGQNELPGTLVDLDLSDSRSTEICAAAIAGRIDIIVNNAGDFRPGHGGLDDARLAMETSYLAAVRLGQFFAPALRARGGDGPYAPCAWVNVLSIAGLVPDAAYPSASAAHAATLAHVRALRPALRPLKLINAFVGPLDDAWHQGLPPPKVTPAQLASAVITALQQGLEEIAIGDVARHTLARWHDNAAITLRE